LKPEPRAKKTTKRIKPVSDKVKELIGDAQERKHLIAECDRVFSLYIRAKFFTGLCYTCGQKIGTDTNEAQCGHFVERGKLITRWLIDNARPQGQCCNEFKGGNLNTFEQKLRAEIGGKRVDYLLKVKRQTYKINNTELQELIGQFSKELSKLK
jgi:hypothetical protein